MTPLPQREHLAVQGRRLAQTLTTPRRQLAQPLRIVQVETINK
jgi:hypothetical protein